MKIPFREHHLLNLLNEWEHSTYPLDLFMSFYFKDHTSLGSKDRLEISEYAYALIRWKGLLDHLSAYPHTWEKRFNTYKENYPFTSCTQGIEDHISVSFPKELFQIIERNYNREEALQFCKVSNTKAPTYIRVNPLKTTRDELLKKWSSLYDITPCSVSPLGIIFNKKIHFFSLPEFQLGFFEIQDEASQLVADQIDAKPGDLVLDYCSGSGGKTLAFAPKLAGKGQIYLHDIRDRSLLEAKKRLKRAGIQNAQIINATELASSKNLKKKMDWILVDAPCSGTGTLRRNPDMKWRFQEENLKNLLGEQRVIFEKALSYLKPDGKIVFATCSILHEENELQTEHFMKTYSLKISKQPFKTIPTFSGMDGFYAVVLEKATN